MPSDTANTGVVERAARRVGRNPVGHAIGQVFYLLGFYAECKVVMVARVLKSAGLFLGGIAAWVFGGAARSVGRFFVSLWQDVTAPFRRMSSGARHIREVVQEEKQKGGAAGRKALGYFGSGVKAYLYLVINLLKLLLPVAAAAVFIFTVHSVLSLRYVLAVELNGEVVGYIETQETFEQARNMLRDRIQAAGEYSAEDYVLTPQLTLATTNELTTKSQLVNNILLSQDYSDDWALVEATGLYVDGELFVTTDIETIEQFFEDMKERYRVGPEAKVDFVETIEYETSPGDLYISASVSSTDELLELFSSVKQEEQTYTANGVETISEIAHDHDLSLTYLLAYNEAWVQSLALDEGEELESDFAPAAGTVLTVQPQQNYLRVRQTYTQWRTEERPFETEYVENAAMLSGRERVQQVGVPGEHEKAYYIEVVDGISIETEASDIAAVVISEPVNQIIEYGTRVGGGGTGLTGEGYQWPVPDYSYCYRGYSGGHKAQDINAPFGTLIYASQGGEVITAEYHWSYGWHVVIQHPDGLRTLYAHAQELYVTAGEYVDQGQALGEVGSTGTSTGPHCHFEVIVDGVRVDPLDYVAMP